MSGKNKNIFFLILTITAGLILIWPFHNFQYYLSQGDHGRDLYCFQKTLEGAVPYRDYSWLFGPLMPYYYSMFYAVFGISIQSVLLGQNVLILLTGVIIFLLCSVFMSRPISLITAASYWILRDIEFFYTYNHIGGLLAIMLSLYFLIKYIDKEKPFYLYSGFFTLFLLTLIRLNIGIVCFAAFFISLCISDNIKKVAGSKKRFIGYLFLSIVSFAAACLIYYIIVSPLPVYILKQCFPYFKPQRPLTLRPSFSECLNLFNSVITSKMSLNLVNYILGVMFILSTFSFIERLLGEKLEDKEKILSYLTSIIIYCVFVSHEFFLSGILYRIYWFFPLLVILFFFFIDLAIKKLPLLIKYALIFSLALIVFYKGLDQHIKIESFKTPSHQIKIGKNNIYTMQGQDWIKPVSDAIKYLKENVKKDETILVMPLDPLYLFLSKRDSATRQLVFFNHMGITEEQQQKMINEMSDKNANWLIISNRAKTVEPELGTLGETYCVTLWQYLINNFEFKAQFGDWDHYPGWAWNHGVRIFKKE